MCIDKRRSMGYDFSMPDIPAEEHEEALKRIEELEDALRNIKSCKLGSVIGDIIDDALKE